MARKLVIASAAVAALCAGVAAGALYVTQARQSARGHAHEKPCAPEPAPKVAYIDVKEVTLRLADSGSEHYIKLSPVLAVRQAKAGEMQDRLPVVRDRIVTIVTARPSTELATPQGEMRLKRDLLAALHQDFQNDIVNIYFNDYLVE